MTLSRLPLAYCTNVHPGTSPAQVLAGLDSFTIPLRDRLQQPLAAGLWLAEPVVREITAESQGVRRFCDQLQRRGLSCHTLNAFPYGDFHSERVKEQVYLPDWGERRRLEYTRRCAAVLAELLPEDADGSISTLPLGFKPFDRPADFRERAAEQLLALAGELSRLRAESGRVVRLAIEPEPFCLLETTPETIAFFRFLFDCADRAGTPEAVREHVGVCYDVCHQAVEFEDVAASIGQLDAEGIRINKVHVSCALKIPRPADDAEARRELARYVEPRYLHQTIARRPDRGLARAVDLTRELALEPPAEFRTAEQWRVHFHVPVDAERLGPLQTTRAELKQALAAVAGLDYAPHLEVETYTWEVLPDGGKVDLVDGLAAEMIATGELLRTTERE